VLVEYKRRPPNATFLLFPLPSHLPKRNSVRQVDAALQTGAWSNIALSLRRIARAAGAQLRSADAKRKSA